MKQISKKTCVQGILAVLLAFEPGLAWAAGAQTGTAKTVSRGPASAAPASTEVKSPIDKEKTRKILLEAVQSLKKNREREPVAEVFRRVGRNMTKQQQYEFAEYVGENFGTMEFPNTKFKDDVFTATAQGKTFTAEFVYQDDVFLKIGKNTISRADAEDTVRFTNRLREIMKHQREPLPQEESVLMRLLLPKAHADGMFSMSQVLPLGLMAVMFFWQKQQNDKNAAAAAQAQAAANYAAQCPAVQRCCQIGSSYAWHSNYCCNEASGVPAIASLCSGATSSSTGITTTTTTAPASSGVKPLPGQK